ncbi:DUF4261 domain-containing protein [Xanthobacter autotrophicus]|uniref:DUF4261 domain-containing protein n=1 Tax=Xanthobacter autotrophicus TaxID=280 RepID=UPI003729F00D
MAQDTSIPRTHLSLVNVFLNEVCTPDYEALVADIAKVEPIKVEHGKNGSTFISWRGTMFILKVADVPIARHLYHGIASTTAFWPEAVTALARHKSFLTVAVFLDEGDLVKGLLNQSILIRCFMEHLPVGGIMRGSVLTSPDWFKFLVDRFHYNGRLPIPAWIKIQLSWDQRGTIASTVGMEDFGLMEVECNPSPLDPDPTLDVVQYFIGFVMEQGSILADGDTFGLAEDMNAYDKTMRVHHAPSFRKDCGTVYLIDFKGFD